MKQSLYVALFLLCSLLFSFVGDVSAAHQRDRTPPVPPVINPVWQGDVVVTGKTESGARVVVAAPLKTYTATAGRSGYFQVPIDAHRAGKALTVWSQDRAGNRSGKVKAIVQKQNPPLAPFVSEVSAFDTHVAGRAERGIAVSVELPDGSIYSATSGKSGYFRISVPAQPPESVLKVYATNKAGDASPATRVRVQAPLPAFPLAPSVEPVFASDTRITGTAEPGVTVSVEFSDGTVRAAKTDASGAFHVLIPVQSTGTVLKVYATDSYGQASPATRVRIQASVQLPAVPLAPSVHAVVASDIRVAGSADPFVTVSVELPSGTIHSSAASASGSFEVPIPAQMAGTVLKVYATDSYGQASPATRVRVQSVPDAPVPIPSPVPSPVPPLPERPPLENLPVIVLAPELNPVGASDSAVTGTASPGTTVTVQINGELFSNAAGADGSFSVPVPAQPPGAKLIVYATDESGNASPANRVIVE